LLVGFEDALHIVQAAVGRWACFGTVPVVRHLSGTRSSGGLHARMVIMMASVAGACSWMVLAVAGHGHGWHRWRAHAPEWSWQWLFPRGAMMSGRSLGYGMNAGYAMNAGESCAGEYPVSGGVVVGPNPGYRCGTLWEFAVGPGKVGCCDHGLFLVGMFKRLCMVVSVLGTWVKDTVLNRSHSLTTVCSFALLSLVALISIPSAGGKQLVHAESPVSRRLGAAMKPCSRSTPAGWG
jgi:hypothetical protein